MSSPSAAAALHATPGPRAVAATGLLGLASAMGVGRFAFTPLLPLMQQRAQIDLAQGTWLAAANYLGYLLGALACARWSVPPALAARWGLLCVAVSTLAMGAGGGIQGWLAFRLLAGAGSALALVGLSAWALHALASAGRPAWAGGVFAGVGTGIAIAGVFSLAAVRFGQSPQRIWTVLGAAAAGIALLAWPGLRTVPLVAADAQRARGRLAFDAQSWRLIIAYGAFGFGYILPATFLPAMARQLLDDPARFGLVWPLFGLAAVVSTLLASRLARDAEPRAVWIAAQLIMAAGVVLPALSRTLCALMISALCVGGTFMVVTMAGMQQARRCAGAAAPRLMAAMTAAFAAGQLIGPLTVGSLAGGALSSRDTVPWAASAVACAVLAAGCALLVGGKRQASSR